jgi:AcrR family transcriptional regulator
MTKTARRDEILDAAAKLLRHYGIRKTTIADIAHEAGIGTGSVYLEFKSKDAIVCGLASRGHDRMLDQLRAILRAETPLGERVIAFFECRTAMFRTACGQGQHASELLRCTGKATSPWARFQDEQRSMLEDAIGDAAVARGVFLAYSPFAPPSDAVYDDDALRSVHALVRKALG